MSNGTESISLASIMQADPAKLREIMASLPKSLVDNIKAAVATEEPPKEAQEQTAVAQPPSPFQPEPEAPKPPPTMFAFVPPEHMTRIPHDYLLFDPERCDGRALFGVPHTVVPLPKQTSVGQAIVFCAIEATPCVVADGRIVECKPGEDILVEVSHWLRRLLRGALDQQSVGEVWARPVGKRRTQDGDFIMEWDLRSGRTWPRNEFRRVLFGK